MSVNKNQCVHYHIDLTRGGIALFHRAATLDTPVGTMPILYCVDGTLGRRTTWWPWPNHVDHRTSGGHSDGRPQHPLPISIVSSTMTLTLLMRCPCCSHHWSRFPIPGLLGHWDRVRGHPGGVCDAQPGLALATHPLGCPAAHLCGPVLCRYPLRHLNLCLLASCCSLYFGGEGVGEGTVL